MQLSETLQGMEYHQTVDEILQKGSSIWKDQEKQDTYDFTQGLFVVLALNHC